MLASVRGDTNYGQLILETTITLGLKAALCGRCVSSERVDNELELGTDLEDAVLYKDKKLKDQVEVAIGDGMEFTIPGIINCV